MQNRKITIQIITFIISSNVFAKNYDLKIANEISSHLSLSVNYFTCSVLSLDYKKSDKLDEKGIEIAKKAAKNAELFFKKNKKNRTILRKISPSGFSFIYYSKLPIEFNLGILKADIKRFEKSYLSKSRSHDEDIGIKVRRYEEKKCEELNLNVKK